jgi:hypothetical protein
MDVIQAKHELRGYMLPRLKPFVEYSFIDGKIYFFASQVQQ